MRTAIICGAPSMGGKEMMALELGEGLRNRNCDVEFVTSCREWTDGDFVRRTQSLSFPVHILRLGFIYATLNLKCMLMTADQVSRWPGMLISYRRFLRRVQPVKIVHTNWHHLLLLWPCFLKPKRDIFWLHEVVPDK